MYFVKVKNAAESRYIPVEDTREIDRVLSNKNGHFEVECDASGTPIIYDELHVKRVCNDKSRKMDTAVVYSDSDILSKIQAAAQAKQLGAATQSSALNVEEEPPVESVAPELTAINKPVVLPSTQKRK